MRVFITEPAIKQLRRLPSQIKKRAQKQFQLLQKNIYHPSLRFKKKKGRADYEGRIDYHYRFSGKFII